MFDNPQLTMIENILSIRSTCCISVIIKSYSYPFQLYGGDQLSDGDGPLLMRAQCFYVIFLAVNGITEAYTFASMDDSQLSW